MKTILFLENGTSGGGSFENLFQCVIHLNKMRFRPVVVFVNKTIFYDRLRARGIPVYVLYDPVYTQTAGQALPRAWVRILIYVKQLLPMSTLIIERLLHYSTICEVRTLIKQYHVDLVHLNNNSVRDLYGVIAANFMRVPCISHLHSARVKYVPLSAKCFLNTHVARFIANSRFTKRYWEELGIISTKVELVYNAIEEVAVAPLSARTQWGIMPSVKYVVGCVGSLAEHKGQAFLIRAFQKVRREEPNIALLIIGEGPSRPLLEQLVRELDLSDSVILTGYDSRAKEIIAGLDLFVLASQSETFGMVLLEAMSTGVSVVATRVGGIPEIIEHGVNGLLVEYGDEQALASAILKVLGDETLRSRFVANGREIVHERFSIKMYIKAIEKIYDEVFSTRT